MGYGTSAHFELPDVVVRQLLNGAELGDVMDRITKDQNTKQKNGAIGFFTRNMLTRKDLYVPGIISALIPFLNPELY